MLKTSALQLSGGNEILHRGLGFAFRTTDDANSKEFNNITANILIFIDIFPLIVYWLAAQRLAAQRSPCSKVEGRVAFGASRSNAMLDNACAAGRIRDRCSWVQAACSKVITTFPFLRPVST